jgi:drug/metabolite transporter (DMT)-like permease
VWPADWAPATAVSIALLGVLCTAIAFTLFFSLIAEAGPARATVITYINTAVAIGLGVAILDERFTPGMILGFPLVIVGSVLAARRSAARHAPAAGMTPATSLPKMKAAQ